MEILAFGVLKVLFRHIFQVQSDYISSSQKKKKEKNRKQMLIPQLFMPCEQRNIIWSSYKTLALIRKIHRGKYIR